MKYRRVDKFKKAYGKLPENIKEKAVKAFSLFKSDPSHPSLRIKRIEGTSAIWEGRIDDFYRFTFQYDTDEAGNTVCTFRNIGRHDIIDREVK